MVLKNKASAVETESIEENCCQVVSLSTCICSHKVIEAQNP